LATLPETRSPPARRVQIELPETYKKVDESVWEELESYLFLGFLTSASTVMGQSFVFKTLNHHEVRNIRFMRSMRATTAESKAAFTAAFIAHSVFMINGNNALYGRSKNLGRLVKTISKIPTRTQDKILDNLSYLNAKASYLYPLVEVYAYENRSRFRWYQLGTFPVHDSRATGLAGTEDLGMTMCQQTWTSINILIDRRETAEREWAHAKFIGSCFAGKGVRPIEERDRARLETERVEREERKIKVLHSYLNRTAGEEDAPQYFTLPDGRKAEVKRKFKAESAEELRDELSAALSGEKDYHDLVIEQKQKEFLERHKSIEADRMKIMYGSNESKSGRSSASGSSRILGGRQEADAYLRRMEEIRLKQMETAQQTVMKIGDGQEPFDDGSEGS
jgi:hypothetical protein